MKQMAYPIRPDMAHKVDAYRHVRDDHGLPITGEYTPEALREVHDRLHECDDCYRSDGTHDENVEH